MNRTEAVIALLCGVVIIITQTIEMLNDRPILLAVGCFSFLGGLIGLIRAKPRGKSGHHDLMVRELPGKFREMNSQNAEPDHWSERGRATSASNSDATDRPPRSVLSLGRHNSHTKGRTT